MLRLVKTTGALVFHDVANSLALRASSLRLCDLGGPFRSRFRMLVRRC
jgi:hypothetical protein